MNPERWQRIKEVAFAAMELQEGQRSQFLDKECGSDSELRRAAEALVEEDQQPGGSIEKAIAAAAAQVQKRSVPEGSDAMLGRTISHYKITDKLGEGGMGIVYKAEDTKLERPVALKFLAAHAIEDPEHKARFVREAKAAARLDHPNICSVYEIDEAEGQTFLAMAYLEGQTVKDKIAERPLKLDEALDIAIQTAQGLKVAHGKGIVHRDIKPANLMLTQEGQVKVMDFGLAQLADRSKLTKTTTMLGTPAYMSPEQALREPTDRRTDVWSLGIVIYEMVTGKLPFEGEREDAVAYSIVHQEPEPITALRVGVPVDLDRIVSKALAKDADERYQHVEDMIVDLRGLGKKLKSGKSTILKAAPPGARSTARASTAVPSFRFARVVVLVLFAVAVGVIVWQQRRPRQPERQVELTRFAFAPGNDVWAPVISPNGRHIVYVTGTQETTQRYDLSGRGRGSKLWVQDLDQEQPRELDGTEGAQWPFWAPGSDFIGFFVRAEAGKEVLKKVSVRGGPAIVLCQDRRGLVAGAWSPDGNSIVVRTGFGGSLAGLLYELPASGGKSSLLIEPEKSEKTGRVQGSPHFLPLEDGRRILLFRNQGQMTMRNLDTGEQEIILEQEIGRRLKGPVYSPSGHILYKTGLTGPLLALPFSIETLRPTGEPFLVPVGQNLLYPSVSADGTLAYLDQPAVRRQLVWRDRSDRKLLVFGQPHELVFDPALSPDGLLVAAVGFENNNGDIWIHDANRPIATRLTFDAAQEHRPVWSPAGDQVAFSSDRQGNNDIFVRPADGSGEVKALVATRWHEFVSDWSSDGRYILYHRRDPETGNDLWYLQRKDDNSGFEAVPFLRTPFSELAANLSPDGHFVAYVSDESGRYEVYVQRFPGGGGKRLVSSNGGGQPRWRHDGKELFYVAHGTLLAVDVTTIPNFSMGSPRELFESEGLNSPTVQYYDVSADGQRFVLRELMEVDDPTVIRVVQNWFAEFRDREQG